MAYYLDLTNSALVPDRWLMANGDTPDAKAGIGKYAEDAYQDLISPECEGVLGVPASRWPAYEVTPQSDGTWHVKHIQKGWTDFVDSLNLLGLN